MEITDDGSAKIAQEIRRGRWLPFFQPVAICSLMAVEFAVSHHIYYAIAFLFSAAVYSPVAIRRYRRNKEISDRVITKYLKWVGEQQA